MDVVETMSIRTLPREDIPDGDTSSECGAAVAYTASEKVRMMLGEEPTAVELSAGSVPTNVGAVKPPV